MTFYTCIAAVAAAASAIIAWAARADSLRAQKDATAAQEQATEIASKSADALDRANRLSEKHFADRIEAERRRQRAQWAALLRGWAVSKSMSATFLRGKPFPSTVRRVQFADVNDARFALDESTAEALQGAVTVAINRMLGELEGLSEEERSKKLADIPVKLVAAEMLIEAWVAEPAGIAGALRTFDAEFATTAPSNLPPDAVKT